MRPQDPSRFHSPLFRMSSRATMERIAPLLGRISRGALYVLPHLVERFAPPLARGWLAAAIFAADASGFSRPRRLAAARSPGATARRQFLARILQVFQGVAAATPPRHRRAGATRPDGRRNPSRFRSRRHDDLPSARRLASSFLAAIAAFAFATAFAAATAHAQTSVTLDGTSGSNSISTAYTLSGDTTFDLGFFADYLIVGGGGGGGGTPGLGAGGGGGGGRVLGHVTGETGNTGAGPLQLGSTSYGITVGAGGAGGEGLTGAQPAAAGGSSTAFDLTAAGGGFGASTNQSGGNGASGGGGNGSSSPTHRRHRNGRLRWRQRREG